MNLKRTIAIGLAFCAVASIASNSSAEVACRVKKTGVVTLRPVKCAKGEVILKNVEIKSPDGKLSVESTSTSSAATTAEGVSVKVQDTGAVSSGSDNNTGLDISVARNGASGGTINTSGLVVDVVGDSGGDSTNVGIFVNTTGADNNYSAVFQGGNVGIGVSDPDEQLELNGRIHLGQSSAPSTPEDKLYNVGGALYWSGQSVTLGNASSGDITGVNAGTGLTGGGASGDVTLSIDAGTSAGDIVQLNSSAQLPAVSGANLTNLNASNITSGALSDGLLSANVSLLGSSINLGTETAGVLGISKGGTGSSSLDDLITLGAHTAGNYVGEISGTSGVSLSSSSAEGGTATLSIDQAFSPTWTGTHSFTGSANVGTTTASAEKLHLNGRLHIEPGSSPSTTTDKLYNVGGQLFFNGLNISTNSAGGDITGVTAGTGLSGGATSGEATLNVNVGTGANQIVQLNGSSALPAVSGANLTTLNGDNISSGTVPDARLSNTVTKLGNSIALDSEITGTLAIANGGTGATSLSNLITLGTHTTGVYVTDLAEGTGISLGETGTEAITTTVNINQAFTPTWTGSHTFSGVASDIQTGTNEDFAIMPNGTGKLGVGTTSPSAKIDAVLNSTSTTAAEEVGTEINVTDVGIVSSGTDITKGIEVNLTRTGSSTSTVESTGLDLVVAGNTSGTSLATGINVSVSGADTNYAALFNGGNVGIGTSSPARTLDIVGGSAATTANSDGGAAIAFTDTGNVSSGTDNTTGLEIDLTRTGASGGTLNSTGLDIAVTGDANGTSVTKGLSVTVSGADTNYAALFSGGNVGIGTNAPTARLDIDKGQTVLYSAGAQGINYSPTINTINAANPTGSLFGISMEPTWSYTTALTAGSADLTVARFGAALTSSGFGAPGSDTANFSAILADPTFNGTVGPRTLDELNGIKTVPTASSGIVTALRGVLSAPVASGTVTDMFGIQIAPSSSGTVTNGYGVYIADVVGTTDYGVYQADPSDLNYYAGSIGIGDTTSIAHANIPAGSAVIGNGTLCVDNGGNDCSDLDRDEGSIYAVATAVTGIDLAENFPVDHGDTVVPGDIVMIDTHIADLCTKKSTSTEGDATCLASKKDEVPFVTKARGSDAADKIVGVISTQPGVTLGGYGQQELISYTKAPVALAGRIPVNVSLENGPIKPGDRITLSSTAGVGMRYQSEGHIVGIALTSFNAAKANVQGFGQVLVLTK